MGSRCNTCRQSSWRLQLSATTSTSREISAFCGRWNGRLGPARSMSLAISANERSCESGILLAGTELQTPSMHCCIDRSGHPAIADGRCRAGRLWPSGPGGQRLAAGEQGRLNPRRCQCRQAPVCATAVVSQEIGSRDAHCLIGETCEFYFDQNENWIKS